MDEREQHDDFPNGTNGSQEDGVPSQYDQPPGKLEEQRSREGRPSRGADRVEPAGDDSTSDYDDTGSAHGAGLANRGDSDVEGRVADPAQPPIPGLDLTAGSLVYEQTSGALPPPSMLAAYEGALQGSSERIFAMAEKALDAQVVVDTEPVKAEAFALRFATVAVSLLPWALLIGALVLYLNDKGTPAAYAGLAGLLFAGGQIISAIRRPRE